MTSKRLMSRSMQRASQESSPAIRWTTKPLMSTTGMIQWTLPIGRRLILVCVPNAVSRTTERMDSTRRSLRFSTPRLLVMRSMDTVPTSSISRRAPWKTAVKAPASVVALAIPSLPRASCLSPRAGTRGTRCLLTSAVPCRLPALMRFSQWAASEKPVRLERMGRARERKSRISHPRVTLRRIARLLMWWHRVFTPACLMPREHSPPKGWERPLLHQLSQAFSEFFLIGTWDPGSGPT
mmetsp:Transcript_51723/g.129910  ORF Transcript_51723/g.129910 Transcript_51723/m.129910 type:complete len:238 (-) Transcript_51723:648-1361(-)